MQKIFLCRSIRFKYRKFVCLVATLLTLLTVASVQPAQAQDMAAKKISLKLNNATVKEALAAIQQQGGFKFVYGPDINKYNTVKITLNGSYTVKQAIDQTLKNTTLRYTQRGGNIMIDEKPASNTHVTKQEPTALRQQNGRISGKVVDEKGEPLIGASVRVVESQQATQSAADGGYSLSVKSGSYTLEVSYISFQTQRITDVVVKDNGNTPLTISMSAGTNTLDQVVVTSGYKKASTAGLYARQKNEAGISNGISREQIGALPDKNVGETLKRISGVSTTDNRRVVVRGIAERYNMAMMDGAALPSTDVQVRDFEFDIVPSNLVDNVVVSKTATPDMSFGFGGGLVQINTMAVPDNNFTTFSFGSKYTNGSTGKDFLGYGRGKNDYLGFDDGGRDHFPKDIFGFGPVGKYRYNPTDPYNTNVPAGATAVTPEMIAAQNKKIGGTERLGTRTYQAMPGQNYQFSLGRSYNLKNSRLGFVGSLSYRNEQAIDDIGQYERGGWQKMPGDARYDAETGELLQATTAKQYNFNTSWGALLNAGWSSKNHKITSRNFYSRSFANQFFRIEGFSGDHPGNYGDNPEVSEYDRPKFIDLLQNRINGEHRFGNFGFDWSVSRNKITNLEQDAVDASLKPIKTINGIVYNYFPGLSTNQSSVNLSRSKYTYNETNWAAEVAAKYNFTIVGQKQQFKAGFQHLDKKGVYNWNVIPIGTAKINYSVQNIPIQNWTSYLDFNDPLADPYYYPRVYDVNSYEGKNKNQAFYGMFDNRFASWIRLVWGLRTESYVYEKILDGASDTYGDAQTTGADKTFYVDPETGNLVHRTLDASAEEKKWRYLPSANLTLTPLKDFNIRASYAKSVVRPSLIENSSFSRYNYVYGRVQRNVGVISTLIDHYDLRLEYYPGTGEVISVGYFNKHFKNPVELYLNVINSSGRLDLVTANSDYADVQGWEFDLRKSFGFIHPEWKFLDNLYLSGNLTLQNSKVQASSFLYESMGGSANSNDNYGNAYNYRTKKFLKEKRPLYGQVPVLYNIGLQYAGERFGANIAFNHSGYKTLTVGMLPEYSENERPRNQLDAQLSYKFLKNKKLETKLNMSNLTNSAYRFYSNSTLTYKQKTGNENKAITDWSDMFEWKYGFSDKYEEGYYETSADGKTKTRIGDIDTFMRKIGTSFSLSVSYSF